MAELLIGRHTHRNMAQALSALPQHAGLTYRHAHRYWRPCHSQLDPEFLWHRCGLDAGFRLSTTRRGIGLPQSADWLITFSTPRNLTLTGDFYGAHDVRGHGRRGGWHRALVSAAHADISSQHSSCCRCMS